MKKYLLVIVLGLIFVPFFAKAEVPSNTFFLGDGKGYDVNGVQTYFCLMDNNCYDITGVFAFIRQAQVDIKDLQNKVTDLQNTVTQLQNQQTQQVVNSPLVAGSGLLPAYTEQQINDKFNIIQSLGSGMGSIKIFPVQLSVATSTVNFSCDGTFDVIFNNQTVLTNCQAPHPELVQPNDALGLREWVIIDNLSPKTTYQYQVTYHESGRNDSVFNKSFTTKAY